MKACNRVFGCSTGLSNTRIHVKMDQVTSCVSQLAPKQARVLHGCGRLMLKSLLVNSGVLLMFSWVAVVSPPVTQSTLNSFMTSSMPMLIAYIRSSTDGALPPSFTQSPIDVQFTCFEPITVDQVVTAVKVLPVKS